jgi:murein DD-endopeptidase MepM/ murein hydrolase activator NlpD
MVVNANPSFIEDFDSWMFHSGMLFDSPYKWWGDWGKRVYPHEGMDFCFFWNRSNHRCRLGIQTRIPVLFDGVVRAVFKDYLGQAIVVEHDIPADGRTSQSRLLTVYAHTLPVEGIEPGRQLNQGDIIATIAGTHRSKADILPHLHLSVAIPAPDLSFDFFVWNIMRDPTRIILLNPMLF